jgi:hypothetical protein
LIDLTQSTWIFYSLQESQATPGESFVLGQSGGDTMNELMGSSSGTLVSGHQYELTVNPFIETGTTSAPSTAHGTGYVTVTFVPEPSVGLLLLAGSVALAGVTPRFSKRAPRG